MSLLYLIKLTIPYYHLIVGYLYWWNKEKIIIKLLHDREVGRMVKERENTQYKDKKIREDLITTFK